VSTPPDAVVVRKQLALSRRDKEFLPGTLEILETPPSPVQSALLVTICALAVVALVWCYFGKIDIIAVAQGKVQPIGRTKVVQSLETGKVQRIPVKDGSRVRAGDVLIELDAREARSDEAELTKALWTFKAEVMRRDAALAAAKSRTLVPLPKLVLDAAMPADLAAREQNVLDGDLSALAADVASLDAQVQAKIAEADHKAMTIKAQKTLIATLQERVDMRSTLIQMNAGSKSNLLDSQEALQVQITSLANLEGEEHQARTSAGVMGRDIDKAYERFVSDTWQKRAEAERQIDETTEKLAKAQTKISHLALVSPSDGIVQGVAVTAPGQVVTVGEDVLQVVPEDAGLEIECYVRNDDIGFVERGDIAQVKVQAFPFTRYGTITAEVTLVGKDAIPEPDALQREGNPASAERPVIFGGAQRIQNLVFPATLALEKKTMMVDAALVPLLPGMAVTVEIKTGQRRIIEYLFSPLTEIASGAGKER
jgi:hemolysin D